MEEKHKWKKGGKVCTMSKSQSLPKFAKHLFIQKCYDLMAKEDILLERPAKQTLFSPLNSAPLASSPGENNNLDVLNYSSNITGTLGPPKFLTLSMALEHQRRNQGYSRQWSVWGHDSQLTKGRTLCSPAAPARRPSAGLGQDKALWADRSPGALDLEQILKRRM